MICPQLENANASSSRSSRKMCCWWFKTTMLFPFAVASFPVCGFCFCLLFHIVLSEEALRCFIISLPLLFCKTCLTYKYKTFNSSTESHTVKLLLRTTHLKWEVVSAEQWKHSTESAIVFLSRFWILTQSTNKPCCWLLMSLDYWNEKELWLHFSRSVTFHTSDWLMNRSDIGKSYLP